MPKYLQLKKEIQSWIDGGKFSANEQLPSENELSVQFNMSRQTVRQALGEMVQDGELYRVHGKGTFVAAAERKTSGELPTIGLLTTYISDYIFPSIVRGAESLLRSKGYRLVLSSTDNDKMKERESLEMMMKYNLSGLIVEPTKSAEGNPNLNYYLNLEKHGIPYLMINEKYSELDCPCLKMDDELGGFIAAEHLIRLGHRKLAGFFKIDDLQGVNRLKGFLRAHREYQIPFIPEWIIRYTTEEKQRVPLQTAEELLNLKEDRPTGFVCYNDELAVLLMDAIRKLNIAVPEQLSVTGFDDSFLATATELKLTTLAHPKMEMGAQAANLLIAMIEKRKQATENGSVIYKPELIVRESTAAAR